MLKPSTAVQSLQQYHPPLGGRDGLRLDFNENTAGCSARVLSRLREITAEEVARYPERGPVERAVADALELDGRQVLLTNGVDEGIHLLAETYLEPGAEAIVVTPTFSMYEIYAAATGARVVTVQCDEEFRFPLDRVLAAIAPQTRLIAIANPNNPTGTVTTRAALLDIAKAAPAAAVLIDEAYFDFYGRSVIDQIGTLENLFVARTFSKAYGMAGLRAGVLAGNAQQIATVKRVASPYNVNGVALACLPEALRDREYVEKYVAGVRENRTRAAGELSQLGLKVWASEANFLLVRIGDRHAAFVKAMRERGILVRDRNSDPGCAGCVRISIGTRGQTETLLAALREVAAEAGVPA